MDIAALVISIVALAVSVGGVAYARRSAIAAEDSARLADETAGIERDRRHHERTPEWHPEVEGGAVPRLHLTLSKGTIDSVVVELDPSQGVSFSPSQTGVSSEQYPPTAASWGTLGVGQRATWRLALSPGMEHVPGTFRIRVKSYQGVERWEETVEVQSPPQPIVRRG